MASAASRTPWRVLVVDDNASLNWSLVTSLRRDGYQADGAATGEAALQYLTQARYECVISDVKMPGMDGFELLQWLRAHQPQARVIMVTAFGSPSARQEAHRGGVIAYLEKPFDLAVLKAELRRLVSESSGSTTAASDGYDLLEVARVISLSRRDIALNVQGGGYTGTLRFLRGELVWADAGPLQGEAAFLALCTPRTGQAQPVAWDGQTERNVTAPVSRLIYHALSSREGRPIGVSGALSLDQQPAEPSSSPEAPASDPAPATPPIAATAESAPPAGASTGQSAEDGPDAADAAADHSTPPAEDTGTETETMETARMPAPVVAPIPAAAPVRVPAASATAPPAPVSTTSGALARVAVPRLDEATREAVRRLSQSLPDPCGVVLLRADGAVLCQSWSGMQEVPVGTYSHLVGAAQAASRALLLADLGTLGDLRIRTQDHALLVRRGTRPEAPSYLVAIVPATADLDAASAALALPGEDETAAHE